MDFCLEKLERRQAALLGLTAISSVVVSYLVYSRVADEERRQSRKHENLLKKAQLRRKDLQAQNSRIVGAHQSIQNKDEPTEEEQQRMHMERMEAELTNAVTGTKTIYFDNNDIMYTEDEVLSGSVKKKRKLTKMKVRVPEQDRKGFTEVQSRQTKDCLNDFLSQINHSKKNYQQRHGLPAQGGRSLGTKTRSHQIRLGLGSELTTSSGTVRSAVNPIKLEPRHFKSKEGTVWLNMFESISNNYCLSKQNEVQSQSFNRNRLVDPTRFGIREPSNSRQGRFDERNTRSSKQLNQRLQSPLNADHAAERELAQNRLSRAQRFEKEKRATRLTRSTSLEHNPINNFE